MRHRHVRLRTRTDSGAGRQPDYVHTWACVYVVVTRDERTSRSEVGYIGQSAGEHRRDRATGLPLARFEEHREEQWWGDLIVHPGVYIVWQGPCTQAQLDGIEQWYIKSGAPHLDGTGSYRPRYNVEHNRDNPRRTPPWEAQRSAISRGHIPPNRSLPSMRPATRVYPRLKTSHTSGSPVSGLVISLMLGALFLLTVACWTSAISRGF